MAKARTSRTRSKRLKVGDLVAGSKRARAVKGGVEPTVGTTSPPLRKVGVVGPCDRPRGVVGPCGRPVSRP